MKRSRLIAGVLFVPILFGCENVPAPQPEHLREPGSSTSSLGTFVTHTLWSGGGAFARWGDQQFSYYDVGVFRDETNEAPSAFLIYQAVTIDPASRICFTDPLIGQYCQYTRATLTVATGPIPANDIRITHDAARLDTNLAANGSLSFVECLGDFAAGTNTCTNVAPSGPFVIQWQKTSAYSARDNRVKLKKVGPFMFRWAGSHTDHSAVASGSVLGSTFQGAGGQLGIGSNVTVEITRNAQVAERRIAVTSARAVAQGETPISGEAVTTTLITKGSGGVAFANWSDPLSFHNVSVDQDTVDGVPSVLLTYDAFTTDPTSEVCVDDPVIGSYCHYTRTTYDVGWGPIPSGDFRVTNAAAQLDTNLAANPNYFFTRCVVDETAGTTTCVDSAPTGPFSIQWQKTSIESEIHVGEVTVTNGPYEFHAAGSVMLHSAIASGFVLGSTFQGATLYCQLGTWSNAILDITRTP